MAEHRATFAIESRADAHAVERLLEGLHDSVREESLTVREGTADSAGPLADFAAMRDAARRPSPGRLTVVLEQEDGGFEA